MFGFKDFANVLRPGTSALNGKVATGAQGAMSDYVNNSSSQFAEGANATVRQAASDAMVSQQTNAALGKIARQAEDAAALESMLNALNTAKNNFLKAIGTGVKGASSPA